MLEIVAAIIIASAAGAIVETGPHTEPSAKCDGYVQVMSDINPGQVLYATCKR